MNEFLHPSQHIEFSNVEKPPAPGGTAPKEPEPEKKKKRSLLKRLALWIAYGFLFLLVLLVGAGIALTYYFPSERIRPIAEKELTGFLKMPVSIESLDLNLLHGITISRLKLGENQPLFEVNDIVLDYDLTKLMQGQFVINQVLVSEPKLNLISVNGGWNFQPLLELGTSDEPPPAVEKKPEGLPDIPIALDLREFAIRNIQVNVDMDGEMKSRLEGLSLNAHGKINREEIDVALRTTMAPPAEGEHNLDFFSSQGKGIDVKTLSLLDMKVSTQDLNNIRLSGTLGLTKNQFRVGDPLPSPDLSVAIDREHPATGPGHRREQPGGHYRLRIESGKRPSF
jgi:autotransporter translocation and assembly factor TamB